LAPGASDTVSTSLTVPAGTAPGSYYVIAQADSANAVLETAETNNSRIAATKVGPDLILTAVSGPATASAGAAIIVSDTTKNQGAGSANGSSTAFYLSVNSTFSSTDVFLGSRAVGDLGTGATATASTSLQIPAGTAPGTYYVIGRADVTNAVAETAETNNDRASGAIKIGGDLVVTAVSAPSMAMAGGPLTVTDTTKNQGAAAVTPSSTGFYLSPNASYDSADVFLGGRSVGSLDVSAISSGSTQLVIPPGTAPGVYYMIAVADWDGVIAESTETNNVRVGGSVRIGPDLSVSTATAPLSAVAGTSISATDTTKNQGAAAAPASTTAFYLSSNATLDAGDTLLATRAVPPLGAGISDTGSVALPIPAATPAGTYHIIVKADGDNVIGESLETNNTYSKSISISGAP
jgi:subtilase family serine protease